MSQHVFSFHRGVRFLLMSMMLNEGLTCNGEAHEAGLLRMFCFYLEALIMFNEEVVSWHGFGRITKGILKAVVLIRDLIVTFYEVILFWPPNFLNLWLKGILLYFLIWLFVSFEERILTQSLFSFFSAMDVNA